MPNTSGHRRPTADAAAMPTDRPPRAARFGAHWRALFCCWLAGCGIARIAPAIDAASDIKRETLFTVSTSGDTSLSQPAIVAVSSESVLVFLEGGAVSDSQTPERIDILMRRRDTTTDGWTAPTPVFPRAPTLSLRSPTPVYDRATRTIWLWTVQNATTPTVATSVDNGRAWSAPRPIQWAASVTPSDPIAVIPGPGHGIQLDRGPGAGRLVIPCLIQTGMGLFAGTLLSDDHGATWYLSALIPIAAAPFDPSAPRSIRISQTRRGYLYLAMGRLGDDIPGGFALSYDDGETWSRLYPWPDDESGRHAFSLVSAPITTSTDGRLYWLGPAGSRNNNITLRLSADGARTWKTGKTLFHGQAGASDIVISETGIITCFYRAGGGPESEERWMLDQFDLQWPETPPPPPEAILLETEATLTAPQGVIHGYGVVYDPSPPLDCFTQWENNDAWIHWQVEIRTPGRFAVEVEQAMGDGGGCEFAIELAGEKLIGVVMGTDTWSTFIREPVGSLTVKAPGVYALSFKPTRQFTTPIVNLRSLRLRRVP